MDEVISIAAALIFVVGLYRFVRDMWKKTTRKKLDNTWTPPEDTNVAWRHYTYRKGIKVCDKEIIAKEDRMIK